MGKKLPTMALIFLLAVLFIACGKGQQEDILLGKWEMFWIKQGEKIIRGKSFKGTTYEFFENGDVLAYNPHSGDSLRTQYAFRNDTLFYVTEGAPEAYVVDSLSADYMQFTVVDAPVESIFRMRKVKKQAK